MITICGYYTPAYRQFFSRLVESNRRFDYDLNFYVQEDMGSWVRNCGLKPFLLSVMMRNWTERRPPTEHDGLLYLDADATIERAIPFEELGDCDIAARRDPKRPESLLSGTLFLRASPGGREILRQWVELQVARPDRWDQVNLSDVVAGMRHQVRLLELPTKWAWIQGIDGEAERNEAIICHWQASRSMRKIVDRAAGTDRNNGKPQV